MARRLTLGFLLVFVVGTCVAKDKDKKKDPDEIGNRDVGKGINFYSIEKEVALGQQLTIEVEKQAKMVDDAIVGEYVNRLGQNLARNSDARMPLTFLSFSRTFEGEADLLGLEYMYKAGYDPNASIDIFERIESLEKRKPGTVAKVFATHPMTADRIRMAQKNINEILPNKPEY